MSDIKCHDNDPSMSHCLQTNVIGIVFLESDSFNWGTNRLLYMCTTKAVSLVFGNKSFLIGVFKTYLDLDNETNRCNTNNNTNTNTI